MDVSQFISRVDRMQERGMARAEIAEQLCEVLRREWSTGNGDSGGFVLIAPSGAKTTSYDDRAKAEGARADRQLEEDRNVAAMVDRWLTRHSDLPEQNAGPAFAVAHPLYPDGRSGDVLAEARFPDAVELGHSLYEGAVIVSVWRRWELDAIGPAGFYARQFEARRI